MSKKDNLVSWDPVAIGGMILQGNDIGDEDCVEATVGTTGHGVAVKAVLGPKTDGQRLVKLKWVPGMDGPIGKRWSQEFETTLGIVMGAFKVAFSRQKELDSGKAGQKIEAAKAAGQVAAGEKPDPKQQKAEVPIQAGPPPGKHEPSAELGGSGAQG